MCLLIALRDVVPDWGLIVAANRDERYDRPGEIPRLLCDDPTVFGGYDPKAGGTWLAVNERGMICAVTNRPRMQPPAGTVRSRGLLCLDAARRKSPIAAADKVGHSLERNDYDGFNLFCAARSGGHFFYFDGQLREKTVGRGLFVVTTGDANDSSIAKVQRVRELLDTDPAPSVEEWLNRLKEVCRDHGGDPTHPNALCLHGQKSGTVSSTILALHNREPNLHVIEHCQGNPCENRYESLALPPGFFTNASSHVPED